MIAPPFRGEIWEDGADVPMQKGYANEGKPFDINTANYLREPFQAVRNPMVREVIIKGAVQTLKTLLTEKSAAYFCQHDPGDMTLYDCDVDAAKDHSKSRIMDYLKSFPALSGQVREAKEDDRHTITTTEFYLPGMTLRVWPLNLSSTQRKTLRYVFIHDAFLSKKTGMITHAKARTTQHPHDKKIIIESQGSDEGDDFDTEWKNSDQRTLHVKCPLCGLGQAFEWYSKKTDGLESGFNRGKEENVINSDGSYNSDAILRETHYVCSHCGGAWHDTRETRDKLDASSYYVAQNPKAKPGVVGFTWPAWINTRIPWGVIMLEYLQAKKDEKEFGNKEPLRQWYQKRAAQTWNDLRALTPIVINSGNYDPNKVIENEHHKGLIIDAQKHPTLDTVGTFWYEVYAADNLGSSFQLERGFVTGWEALDKIQEKWKIPNHFVAIDGMKWTPEILKQVAARRVIAKTMVYGRERQFYSTWRVFFGDAPARSYPWPDKLHRVWAPPTPRPEVILNAQGKQERVNVFTYRWSNLSVKDQLNALLIGGEGKPKFEALKYDQLSQETQAKEHGDLAYDVQINSEIRTEKNGRPVWEKIRPNNHYRDIACMRIVRIAQEGLVGHIAPPE